MAVCLLIHGFIGSKEEVMPLADYLRAHTDWDILAPTLPGHDKLQQLRSVTYKDWLVFIESILVQLNKEEEEIYLVGYSMGGLLATFIARHHPEVKKLALLSTPVTNLDWSKFANTKKAQIFFLRKKITEIPKGSILQFEKMISLARPVFSHIKMPTFLAWGGKDKLMDISESDSFLSTHLSGPTEKYILTEAGHSVCQAEEAKRLFSELLTFFKKA